jgi:hypothetical protein
MFRYCVAYRTTGTNSEWRRSAAVRLIQARAIKAKLEEMGYDARVERTSEAPGNARPDSGPPVARRKQVAGKQCDLRKMFSLLRGMPATELALCEHAAISRATFFRQIAGMRTHLKVDVKLVDRVWKVLDWGFINPQRFLATQDRTQKEQEHADSNTPTRRAGHDRDERHSDDLEG